MGKILKNYQWRSFRGQNLTGKDFSDTDIRGADFRGAILHQVNFSHAVAGLPFLTTLGWLAVALLLLGVAGFITALNSMTLAVFFLPIAIKKFGIFSSLSILTITVVFVISLIRYDFKKAFRRVSTTLGLIGGLSVFLALFSFQLSSSTFGAALYTASFLIPFYSVSLFLGSVAIAITLTLSNLWFLGIICFIPLIIDLVIAIVLTVTMVFNVSQALAMDTDQFAFSLAKFFVVGKTDFSAIQLLSGVAGSLAIVIVAVMGGFILMAHIGWKALADNPQYRWIKQTAIALISIGSTSFYEADLTGANFSYAQLKGVNFGNANLTHSVWFFAHFLNVARWGNTPLANRQIRDLLITKNGVNQNCDRLELRKLNLQKSNLSNISLIDTDLSQSDLSFADLSNAILVRSQLEQANLTGVNLTGACIDSWNITQTTQLNRIECDYIYLRWQSGNKCDRLPKQGNFEPGEFVRFIKSILDTIDLYHDGEINPQAAVIILNNLANQHSETLEIVGLEKRGERFILKIKTSPYADTEQLKQDYYDHYSTFQLSLTDTTSILPHYSSLAAQVAELIEQVKQPNTNIITLYNQGILITGGQANITLNSASSKLTDSLILFYQQAIETDINLPPEETSEALAQLQTLVKSVDSGILSNSGKKALRILQGMTQEFPQATQFTTIVKELENYVK